MAEVNSNSTITSDGKKTIVTVNGKKHTLNGNASNICIINGKLYHNGNLVEIDDTKVKTEQSPLMRRIKEWFKDRVDNFFEFIDDVTDAFVDVLDELFL